MVFGPSTVRVISHLMLLVQHSAVEIDGLLRRSLKYFRGFVRGYVQFVACVVMSRFDNQTIPNALAAKTD